MANSLHSVAGLMLSRHGSGLARFGLLTALFATVAVLLLTFAATPVEAQSASVDYDADSDGLIEVANLAQLNAIRWDMDGNGHVSASDQAGYNTAFPNAAACGGCHGYELMTDLNFDENNDNQITSADGTYWNGGAGWLPLGILPAGSQLQGNGHTISNLYINRPRTNDVGLVSITDGGFVKRLGLVNASVTGNYDVGAVVGRANVGGVHESYATGRVSGTYGVGGLVGWVSTNAQIRTSYSAGHASASHSYAGGLVGFTGGWIENSYSTAAASSSRSAGGLAGGNGYGGVIENTYATGGVFSPDAAGLAKKLTTGVVTASYWDSRTTAQTGGGGDSKTTAELRTPTGATGIYSTWPTSTWDFGTSSQYPVLKADWSGDGVASAAEFGTQDRTQRPPVFSVSRTVFNVAENSAQGTPVVTYTAIDPNGGSPTYFLSGADAGYFSIDSTTGAITAKGDLDYESKPSYSVAVGAVTDRGGVKRQAITINLYDLVERFAFYDGPSKTIDIREDFGWYRDISASPKASHPEGKSLTYTVGGTDAGKFGISSSSGLLHLTARLDYETSTSHSIIVTATDGLLTSSINVTIQVTDVNEPPSFTSNSFAFTVQEGAAADTVIGRLTATDPDAGNTVTYHIMQYEALRRFKIDGDQIKAKADVWSKQIRSSYTFTVTVQDAAGLSDAATVEISVTALPVPQNTAPQFLLESATFEIVEGQWLYGSRVGYPLYATDAEGDSLTYALIGADWADFTFNYTTPGEGVALATYSALDYEAKNSYSVAFTVNDGRDSSGNADSSVDDTVFVTVNVLDANEPPSFVDTSDRTFSIAAQAAVGTNVGGVLSATDPEGDSLNYVLGARAYSSAGDAEKAFSINNTGQISVQQELPYLCCSSYKLIVSISDGGDPAGHPDMAPDAAIYVTINLTGNVKIGHNSPPTLVRGLDYVDFAEGDPVGSNVGKFLFRDPDGDTLTYTLSGTDAASFTSFGDMLLRNAEILYYRTKTQYEVTITASDGRNGSVSHDVIVLLKDRNINPTFDVSGPKTCSVRADAPLGALVCAVPASDPDGDDIEFLLQGALAGYFEVDSSGTIRVARPLGSPRTITGLTLWVDDWMNWGFARQRIYRDDKRAITIRITAVNSSPPASDVNVSALSNKAAPASVDGSAVSVTVTEGIEPGTFVRSIEFTDADDDVLAYSLSGAQAAYFEVTAGQTRWKFGAASLTVKQRLLVTTANPHVVVVTANDGKGGTEAVTVTVNLRDINLVPSFDDGTTKTFDVAEGVAVGTVVGNIPATDLDGDALTYRLTGDLISYFAVSNSGEITTAKTMNYDDHSSFTIAGWVTDGQTHDFSAQTNLFDDIIRITINVTRAPVSAAAQGASPPVSVSPPVHVSDDADDDSGSTGDDAGSTDDDSGSSGDDAGSTDDDSGSSDDDAGSTDDDSGSSDDDAGGADNVVTMVAQGTLNAHHIGDMVVIDLRDTPTGTWYVELERDGVRFEGRAMITALAYRDYKVEADRSYSYVLYAYDKDENLIAVLTAVAAP